MLILLIVTTLPKYHILYPCTPCFSKICHTRSLGALRAPTSSWWPFGPAWLRPSRPTGAQAVWPTHQCRCWLCQALRNTPWSFGEILLAKLEKYSSPFRWGVKNVTNQRTNGPTNEQGVSRSRIYIYIYMWSLTREASLVSSFVPGGQTGGLGRRDKVLLGKFGCAISMLTACQPLEKMLFCGQHTLIFCF